MSKFANYLFEVGLFAATPRAEPALVGARQSAGAHAFRALHVAWLLGRLSAEPIDAYRLLLLVLFHELPEARTGNLSPLQQQYTRVDRARLLADLAAELPFGEDVAGLLREYEAGATREAQLARDAALLESILVLKEQADLGNRVAADALQASRGGLRTAEGQRLADEILVTPSDDWWFHDKADRHWIDRGRD